MTISQNTSMIIFIHTHATSPTAHLCLRMRISSVQPFCKPQRTLPKGHHWIHWQWHCEVKPRYPKVFDFAGSAPIHKSNLTVNRWIRICGHKTSKRKPRCQASPCLDYYTAQLGARDRLPPWRVHVCCCSINEKNRKKCCKCRLRAEIATGHHLCAARTCR